MGYVYNHKYKQFSEVRHMVQMTLFLGEKQEAKVNKLKEIWHKNKHDTVLKIIDEYKEVNQNERK